MECCRLIRSLSTAFCAALGAVALLGIGSPKAHAQWSFAGSYVDTPYYDESYWVAAYMFESHPGIAYSYSGAAGSSVWSASAQTGIVAHGIEETYEDENGTWTEIYGGNTNGEAHTLYTYYPMFVWSGVGTGNPGTPLTSAAVSASGTASATYYDNTYPTGGFSSSFCAMRTIDYNIVVDQWTYNNEPTSNTTSQSGDFYLPVLAIDPYTSIGTYKVQFEANASVYAYSTDLSYSSFYYAQSATNVGYTLSW